MSGRCPTGWPHDSHTATLISVPPLWVCTPVLTCCINCGLHRGLCTSSVVLLKTKQKAPKEQADWSCAKALHECRWASLDTGSIAVFAGTSACWVTGQEGGHCGWKVARAVWHCTYGLVTHGISFQKLAAGKLIAVSIVIAGLSTGLQKWTPERQKSTILRSLAKTPLFPRGIFSRLKNCRLWPTKHCFRLCLDFENRGHGGTFFLQLYQVNRQTFKDKILI